MFSDDAGVFGRPVRANCTCIQNSNTNYRTMKIYKTFGEDDDIVAAFFAFFLGILVLVLRSKHRGSKLGNRIKSDIGRFLGTCPGRCTVIRYRSYLYLAMGRLAVRGRTKGRDHHWRRFNVSLYIAHIQPLTLPSIDFRLRRVSELVAVFTSVHRG